MKPISYMEAFADVVRARRSALGIDQATVADLAGVSRKAVSDVERGKATIRFDTLSKITDALGLTIEIS